MTFNDGIFTIAITLLILEIRIPEIPSAEIDARFLESIMVIFPKILGFILSFFIITMFWLSYHRFFQFIRNTDTTLILENILFLFFIVFMPFPTYLLGLYGDHKTIVIFYALIVVVTCALLSLLWKHASTNYLLIEPDLDSDIIRFLWNRSLIPTAIFLLSIGIAFFFSPLLAMVSWVLNFVIMYGYRSTYGDTGQ